MTVSGLTRTSASAIPSRRARAPFRANGPFREPQPPRPPALQHLQEDTRWSHVRDRLCDCHVTHATAIVTVFCFSFQSDPPSSIDVLEVNSMASLHESSGRRDGSGSSELVNLSVVDRLLGIVGDESDHMDGTAVLVEDQDVTSARGHLISHIGLRSTLSADRRARSRSSAWASLAMRVVRRRERTEQHGCHRGTLKTLTDSVLRPGMFAAATPLVHVRPAQASEAGVSTRSAYSGFCDRVTLAARR